MKIVALFYASYVKAENPFLVMFSEKLRSNTCNSFSKKQKNLSASIAEQTSAYKVSGNICTAVVISLPS
jgi:hypothetical protein